MGGMDKLVCPCKKYGVEKYIEPSGGYVLLSS
jgi:hypothetical protein